MQLFINKEKSFFSILVVLGVLVFIFAGSASAQKVRLRSQMTPACTSVSGANLKYADVYADGNIAVQGSYGCRGVFIYDIYQPGCPGPGLVV